MNGFNGTRRCLAIVTMLAVAAMGGCSLDADYVKADRATKTAIEPSVRQFTADHPEEKDQADAVMYSWEKRLSAAEKAGR